MAVLSIHVPDAHPAAAWGPGCLTVAQVALLAGARLANARTDAAPVLPSKSPALAFPEDVIDAVCAEFEVSKAAVLSRDRAARATGARQAACYLLRRVAGETVSRTGERVGRCWATVAWSERAAEREAARSPSYAAALAGAAARAIKASAKRRKKA